MSRLRGPDKLAPTDVPNGFVPVDRPSPFLDLIGPLWVRVGDDGTPPVYGLRVETRHSNARGKAHGGILMTMADLVLGYSTAFSQKPPVPLTTASTTVDFAGSAAVGDWLEGLADVQHIGRKLAFVNAYLSVGKRRIIRASAVFAVTDEQATDRVPGRHSRVSQPSPPTANATG